ncbi:MAG: dual OB domain-containing protein, partial [Prochlorotrichaceae cyanobacterium]
MSTMNVICLANSYKHYDRCIAGIESTSGQWIRPVSDLDDGRIPKNDRFIKAEEITLLDRVDIPIHKTQKSGHEIENFRYTRGAWKITGKAQVADLLRYCELDLLYPKYQQAIPYAYLQQNAPVRSLQLIEVKSFVCQKNRWDKWRGVILDEQYHLMDVELSITDPMTLEKLERGESISTHALLCL